MKILALDIATKTWWSTKEASGTWDLKLRNGESNGMKLIRLRAKVSEVIQSEWIDFVVYERPAGRFANAIIHEAELIGALKCLLEDKGIQYTALSATEIKKHATGKWNAKKPDMIEAAKKIRPLAQVIDDNEWDAICLYDLAEKLYNL